MIGGQSVVGEQRFAWRKTVSGAQDCPPHLAGIPRTRRASHDPSRPGFPRAQHGVHGAPVATRQSHRDLIKRAAASPVGRLRNEASRVKKDEEIAHYEKGKSNHHRHRRQSRHRV